MDWNIAYILWTTNMLQFSFCFVIEIVLLVLPNQLYQQSIFLIHFSWFHCCCISAHVFACVLCSIHPPIHPHTHTHGTKANDSLPYCRHIHRTHICEPINPFVRCTSHLLTPNPLTTYTCTRWTDCPLTTISFSIHLITCAHVCVCLRSWVVPKNLLRTTSTRYIYGYPFISIDDKGRMHWYLHSYGTVYAMPPTPRGSDICHTYKQAIRKQKKAINFQYDMQHFLQSAIVLDHFYFAFSTLFSFFSFSLRVTILADQKVWSCRGLRSSSMR